MTVTFSGINGHLSARRGYLEDLDQAESTAAKNDAGRVDEEGFVSAMLSVGDINEGNARGMYLDLALTIQDHTKALLDLNFAGSYCGNKGVLALIKPICEHYGGGTIDLSSSGLHNAAVKQLCEALTFHEVRRIFPNLRVLNCVSAHTHTARCQHDSGFG